MQWVETTGRTIEEAKEAALDQLGIDSTEAEFEVLEEAKTGLFGRVRSEARVRARVAPKSPRPKQERRPRKAKAPAAAAAKAGGRSPKAEAPASGSDEEADVAEAAPAAASSGQRKRGGGRSGGSARPTDSDAAQSSTDGSKRRRDSRSRSGSTSGGSTAANQEGNDMTDDVVAVDAQADIISEFLEGLLAAAGLEGTISRTKVDDETIELGVEGNDLGILIGPKGQTLSAVHEVSRTVLQRQATGRHEGRVRIDIGGYRQRRQEALARFVQAQADEVSEQGVARALEPMNAADRKIVHDTVNDLEGVSTISEGTDPDRRVVIVPGGADE